MLERLQAEAEDTPPEPADAPAFAQVSGLSASFAPERDRAALNHGADATGAYREFAGEAPNFESPDVHTAGPAAPDQAAPDPDVPAPEMPASEMAAPEPAPPPPPPAHLLRLSPEEIAGELALSAQDTLESLAAKRRRFARANHPDAHDGAWREAATRRMTIANMLIDEAARRLRRQAGLMAADRAKGKARTGQAPQASGSQARR
ncbi:hypothetical protein BJF92_15130 [Rhizobium rhizosphaerae]|uniref:J domain-containing protein n=1 Tax=Xaviernesmea rhizosphaerae TaxID=1672749 RepID=A0A1Q9AGL4_9HYPH|nr:hypothetical protein [Xaviernesmea rhizosphaerae]OLP54324.1 hypothetical protein BJF92_15130 [Xaviernesmea rhizosphaerae]